MGMFGQSRERQPRQPAPDRCTANFRYRNTTLTGIKMADEPLMPQTEPEMCLSKHQVELLPLNPVMLSEMQHHRLFSSHLYILKVSHHLAAILEIFFLVLM